MLVIVIGGIIFWLLYAENDKSKAKSAERAKKETTHKAIIELANKHNAVVDWKEPLIKIETRVFTMEVEDALLRKDSRPVLFLSQVNDVERKENTYMVRFVNELGRDPQIEFVLDCTDEQVRKITQQQSEFKYSKKYAVVAVINKVKKVAFGVNPVVTSDDGEKYGEIEIDTPDIFVATGRCVDLLFVEDYDDYDLYPEDKGE